MIVQYKSSHISSLCIYEFAVHALGVLVCYVNSENSSKFPDLKKMSNLIEQHTIIQPPIILYFVHRLVTEFLLNFFSNQDTKTILLEDMNRLTTLKDALQHTLQRGGKTLQDILDYLPDVVLSGDNPLYWTNTNKNANHAHFSKDKYEHWFSK